MNMYQSYLAGINPDEWELFGADFIEQQGYQLLTRPAVGPDRGKDFLASFGTRKYLVSCKHHIISGRSIGPSIERNPFERVNLHECDGFIGIYSSIVSQGLYDQLNGLRNLIDVKIYDIWEISKLIPNLPHWIVQRYGPLKGVVIPLHVSRDEYRPLICCGGCGADLLQDDKIFHGEAVVFCDRDSTAHYVYGCKKCLSVLGEVPSIELYQALFPDQLSGWNSFLRRYEQGRVSPEYYQRKSEFSDAVQQRSFSRLDGTWIG